MVQTSAFVLHNITITDKSSNSHHDIPADSNLFLQLILDGNNHLDLELQHLGEHLYKECPDSNDPDHGDALNLIEIRACISHVFIAVCRSSQTRGNRLLGWMIIHQADLEQTSSGEWCILATNVQVMNHPGFCAPFKMVNADGPCLELSASVSASLAESDVGHSEQIAAMCYSNLARPDLFTIDVLFAEGDQLLGILKDSGTLDSTSIFILYEKILLLPSSPSRGLLFKILGSIHLQHYKNTKAMADLNQAVSLYHDADRDTPWNHNKKFDSLSSLAYALALRFEHLSQLSDISEAISAIQAAVELVADDHADKPTLLSSLGGYFRDRYERFGVLEDINASISNRELALQLTPDGSPSMSSRLHGLASVLSIRFQHTADPKDSDGAILKMKAAIQLISEQQSENLPAALETLGLALLARYERLGDQNNINESVSTLQTAVSMTLDEDRRLPRLLNALASSRGRRFIDSGDIVDINTSITLLERAIQLSPPRDVFLPSYLRTLGDTLLARFEHFGEVNDINNAIIQAEAAVNLTSNGDHAKPSRLSSLADALSSRFERFGNLHDLNNAISRQETAVSLTPHSHAAMPGRLHNLAQFLDMRFGLLGDLTDLSNCISRAEAAMQLIPHLHVDKPLHMKSLGLILYQRFSRLESRKDIDDAILITDAAIRLLPDNDTSRYQYLGNLANFLAVRSQTFGEKLDIHRAITLTEEAVQLVPEGHPSKAQLINDLGTNIGLRFDHFGNLEDLNNSLSLIEKSIQLIPSDHFNHPRFCLSLGYAVLTLMQHLEDHDQELDPQIFDRLVSAFSTAAQSVVGSSSTRFTAASVWARSAHRLLSPPSLEGYMTAMRLLPELVWLGLSISDRHHHLLGNATRLVRDAVAAAIEAGEHEKAVEWFEQGQSIIWSQILELRQPVEELERAHPDLAHRLVELSKRLDSFSDDQIALRSETTSASQFPKLNQHHKIAQDREELLQKIRSLNGFETFLSPPTLTGVAHSARGRTLVMLNVHESRCDALVLKDDHVLLVPLDGLTYEHARKMQETLNLLLVNSGSRLHLDRIPDYDDGIADSQSKFKRILAELWVCIAKPILNGLGISLPSDTKMMTRIWWVCTGPLAFLPLHAAGLYDDANQAPGSKMSDFVISSYTPTVSSLMTGKASGPDSAFQLLSVGLPIASRLPCVEDELDRIDKHANKFTILRLNESAATVDNVIDGMKQSSWVHFACHGEQKVSNPTDSALLLANGSRLTLSKIIQLHLPHADLAFLSACQTATGTEVLAEEAVHLTAGLLLAGYRGVIGTMWSIMDKDAPDVADEVYTELLSMDKPDSSQAAYALHVAVKNLRQKPDQSFFSWVPFVHFGI